jgi:hypothetical protein
MINNKQHKKRGANHKENAAFQQFGRATIAV